MVDILLISIGFDNNERYRIYSLSLGVLKASILHHFPNLKVYTIDAYDRKMSESEIMETVIGLNPHIVGFSSTTFYYQQISRIFSEIERQNPYIWRVVGGYISLLENCLSLTHADIVVRGEGDFTIADLCKAFFKFSKNRAIQRVPKPEISEKTLSEIQGIYYRWPLLGPTFEIKFTGHRPLLDNLDVLPTPDFDDVMQTTTSEEFAFALYCQRGCYNNCSFCDILQFFGRVGIRSMSPKRIIQHINVLREKYDAREISFVDDNFMSSRAFLEEFISEFEASGLIGKVMIDFQSRANDIIRYKDLLEKMVPFVAGVQIGIESFVDSQLKRYNKHITAEQNMQALQILSDLKISYLAYYILLDPNVTLEEIEENIEKLKEAPPVPVKRHKFFLPHLIAQTEFEIELDVWGKMRISGIPHLEAFNEFMEQTEDKMKEIEKIYQSLKIAQVYNNSETLANSIALSSAKLFFTIAEQIAEERLDMALEVCEKIYYRRFFKHRYKKVVDKQVKKFNEQVESLLRVVRLTGLPVEEILGLIENEE
jgi:radical SAM superfamily enzyme YgiQ (UPF0313 family)